MSEKKLVLMGEGTSRARHHSRHLATDRNLSGMGITRVHGAAALLFVLHGRVLSALGPKSCDGIIITGVSLIEIDPKPDDAKSGKQQAPPSVRLHRRSGNTMQRKGTTII